MQVKSSRVLRERQFTAPHSWHVREVSRAGTTITVAHLQSSMVLNAVQPVLRMTRLMPDFRATIVPGPPAVPFALFVMARTCRFSTAIVPAFAASLRLT